MYTLLFLHSPCVSEVDRKRGKREEEEGEEGKIEERIGRRERR
jgi:hypothetical protein